MTNHNNEGDKMDAVMAKVLADVHSLSEEGRVTVIMMACAALGIERRVRHGLEILQTDEVGMAHARALKQQHDNINTMLDKIKRGGK